MITLLPRGRLAPSLVLDFLTGLMDSRIAFSRASSAWSFDAGGTLVQAPANTARFDVDPATLAPRGLLMEGQRTNTVRNPRAEGATPGIIGAGGVAPTNWVFANNAPGVSAQTIGTGIEAGIPFVDVRFFGTTTGTGSLSVFPEQSTGVAALSGPTWTFSIAARLVAGSMNGLNNAAVLCWNEYDATGTNAVKFSVVNSSAAAIIGTATSLAQARQSGTSTLSGGAATAYLQPRLFFNLVSQGVALDCTFRIGIPQLERGAFASSPILPPAGSPSAATRADDVAAIADVSALVSPAAGALFAEVDAAFTDTSFNYGILGIDAGSAADTLRSFAGSGATAVFQCRAGGANSWYRPGQALTPNAVNRTVITWAAGTGRASVNGGTITTDAGTLPASAPRLLLGCASEGSIAPLFGHLRRVRAWPGVLSSSQMLAEQA